LELELRVTDIFRDVGDGSGGDWGILGSTNMLHIYNMSGLCTLGFRIEPFITCHKYDINLVTSI